MKILKRFCGLLRIYKLYLPDNDHGKDPYKYPVESTDSDTGNNGGSCKLKSDWNLLGKLGLNNPGVSAGSSLQ